MTYVCKQPYKKVIREVSRLEQTNTSEIRYMYLYENKITTKYREFLLEEVMDISFKQMQDEEGMLFLHTNHGVYSYHVPSAPGEFIEKCKSSIRK